MTPSSQGMETTQYPGRFILLLPSNVESFGFPVLEAVAVGCPVVCSDLPALREIAAGNDLGLHHRIGDSGEAADLALTLADQSAGQRTGVERTILGPPMAAGQVEVVGQWVHREVGVSNASASGCRE